MACGDELCYDSRWGVANSFCSVELAPMPIHSAILRAACGWLIGTACAGIASATLVSVTFSTQNPPRDGFPGGGGPLWTGVVDTVADTLTIHSWTELPGTPYIWEPGNLSLVWPAVDASGNRYDVTDDHFDEAHATFRITDQFAFISPLSARTMAWDNGAFGQLPGDRAAVDFFPGWGGFADFNAAGELRFRVAYGENWMPALPTDDSGGRADMTADKSFIFGISNGAVTASIVPGSDGPVAVPEASALLFGFGAACLATCLAAWRGRASRQQLATQLATRAADR